MFIFYIFLKCIFVIIYQKMYYFVAFKFIFNQRGIKGLVHYSLNSIKGGYNFIYSGRMWLDFISNPKSESSLSINTYYSLDEGLSAVSDIKICVPVFKKKVK